tara:strand:- start:33 stop:1046 length:1014 start_codon:yes stop_codon:yes gene_type:complete
MAFTTINKSTEYFSSDIWSGNSGTQTISAGGQRDMTWFKVRNGTRVHRLQDAVRGVTKALQPNDSAAEGSETTMITAFNSSGYTTGSDADINASGSNYVGWSWKANGAGSANTNGDIASTVSVNTTSGFSIVSWTANGSNNATIGHGLSSTPKIVLYKKLNDVDSWYVVYTFVDGTQDYLVLNDTTAKADLASGTYGTATSTTISNIGFPNSNSLIAYCFADVQGYSKFSSYIGNGNADGTFVYTGFKPAFVMIKATSGTENWQMYDNKRLGYNVDNNMLRANLSNAEQTDDDIDILSNGFKLRRNSGAFNNSGSTYIYMAIGQSLVGTNNIPNNAR